MYLTLERTSDDGQQTLGKLSLRDQRGNCLLKFDCLELPWRNNKRQVSCIPNGVYVVRRKLSIRYGWCFEIMNVLGRSGILIHKGNFKKDTKGCLLIGNGLMHIDDDGLLDIMNSRFCMNLLLNNLKTNTTITISSKWLSYELKK